MGKKIQNFYTTASRNLPFGNAACDSMKRSFLTGQKDSETSAACSPGQKLVSSYRIHTEWSECGSSILLVDLIVQTLEPEDCRPEPYTQQRILRMLAKECMYPVPKVTRKCAKLGIMISKAWRQADLRRRRGNWGKAIEQY